MAGSTVLVVDDEVQIRRLLALSLKKHGFRVETVDTGEAAIDRLLESAPDLVLLDLGLPDIDGHEVCREIRRWSQVPIIVVSVRNEDREKVRALDLGADDFVTKPFSIDELLARIRAHLRRVPATTEEPVIVIGPIVVDAARRLVLKNGAELRLTPTEYGLALMLARNAGRVITHRALLREIRGPAFEDDTPILRVHMVALRQKMNVAPGSPGYINTEPGVGYRLLES